MGVSCDCRNPITDSVNILNMEQEPDKEYDFIRKRDLEIFKFPRISSNDYDFVKKKIQEMTGFRPYMHMNLKLNKKQQKLEGTYFQYNKGCIIYALINNGWIDEKYIPDSMKYYKNHNHWEDKKNDTDFLRKITSVIDLSQLWVNIGGECPYLEIDLNEVKKRIYLVLKDYFDKPDGDIMKKVAMMSFQTKDYYELLGNINIKYKPLKELIKENPCIKKGIDEGIINKRDMIKFGRHCFIFDEIIINEENKKIYSFQDSLSYFHRNKKKPNPNYENCECDKKKGFVYANEDRPLINVNNDDKFEIGILSVI